MSEAWGIGNSWVLWIIFLRNLNSHFENLLIFKKNICVWWTQSSKKLGFPTLSKILFKSRKQQILNLMNSLLPKGLFFPNSFYDSFKIVKMSNSAFNELTIAKTWVVKLFFRVIFYTSIIFLGVGMLQGCMGAFPRKKGGCRCW